MIQAWEGAKLERLGDPDPRIPETPRPPLDDPVFAGALVSMSRSSFALVPAASQWQSRSPLAKLRVPPPDGRPRKQRIDERTDYGEGLGEGRRDQ